MDFSVDIIKNDIINLSTKDFIIKYLLKSDNWYFSKYLGLETNDAIQRMEGLKGLLNSKLEIAYHNVLMVGSGKIGCSLSPEKIFRQFNEDSDIDIAIISSKRFNDIWGKIRIASMDEHISYQSITSSIFRGFINEKQFSNIAFARQYWNEQITDLNRSIQEEIGIYHQINYRIYRSWEDLEDYHMNGVNKLRNNILNYGNKLQ